MTNPTRVERDLTVPLIRWDEHDRLMGVIDWECAGVGHPGIDLGMQRCDAALTVGQGGADAVLAGYEACTGRSALDVAYWDIAAALTTPPTMESFVQTIIGQGRTDLDPATLLERRDIFLEAAVANLTADSRTTA
jgi:aminoglycoside phosphotransferase (APT) family kinase protein